MSLLRCTAALAAGSLLLGRCCQAEWGLPVLPRSRAATSHYSCCLGAPTRMQQVGWTSPVCTAGARSAESSLEDRHRAVNMCQCFCRAGSVCLDVINQTWSPMFGEPMHNCMQCMCCHVPSCGSEHPEMSAALVLTGDLPPVNPAESSTLCSCATNQFCWSVTDQSGCSALQTC